MAPAAPKDHLDWLLCSLKVRVITLTTLMSIKMADISWFQQHFLSLHQENSCVLKGGNEWKSLPWRRNRRKLKVHSPSNALIALFSLNWNCDACITGLFSFLLIFSLTFTHSLSLSLSLCPVSVKVTWFMNSLHWSSDQDQSPRINPRPPVIFYLPLAFFSFCSFFFFRPSFINKDPDSLTTQLH